MMDFEAQRKRMVRQYREHGYIKTDAMEQAMLKVPREAFMDKRYIEYSYGDQPMPIPGDGRQTISAPYMYPIFYEPLQLKPGSKVLEIGTGSGYGAALAKELVGEEGLVVTIEINPITYNFAISNLRRLGYDVTVILGDGSLGYPEKAPYDAICVTAACPEIPQPLIDQLKSPGKLMAPVGGLSSFFGQDLVLLEKNEQGGVERRVLMQVVYVPLLGKYGWVNE